MSMFALGVLAAPVGAVSMALTWWAVGRLIGLLRYPIVGLVRLRRPEKIIALLERKRNVRAFRFSMPGFVVLVIADREEADR